MEYRKVRNKEYVLNEIYKLQLLLKIWFLDNVTTDKERLSKYIISNQLNTFIPKLREFYSSLYSDSRTPRSSIRGSPQNLAQNFKEIDPSVGNAIQSYISNKNSLSEETIIKFVESQMGIIMKNRNSNKGKTPEVANKKGVDPY
jgi:hypothetical protein